MYVYMKLEPGLYTVGYYRPGDNAWCPESDWPTKEEAVLRVRYLNGGSTVVHREPLLPTKPAPTGRRTP